MWTTESGRPRSAGPSHDNVQDTGAADDDTVIDTDTAKDKDERDRVQKEETKGDQLTTDTQISPRGMAGSLIPSPPPRRPLVGVCCCPSQCLQDPSRRKIIHGQLYTVFFCPRCSQNLSMHKKCAREYTTSKRQGHVLPCPDIECPGEVRKEEDQKVVMDKAGKAEKRIVHTRVLRQ